MAMVTCPGCLERNERIAALERPVAELEARLSLKPPVAGGAKDLGRSELKELEFAPERPAAELPDAQVPAAEPLGQLVGVTGSQRLQEHERPPVALCRRRQIAVFRLDCTPAKHILEEFAEKNPRPGGDCLL